MCNVYLVFLVTLFGVFITLFSAFRYVVGKTIYRNIGNDLSLRWGLKDPSGVLSRLCVHLSLCISVSLSGRPRLFLAIKTHVL